MQEHIYKPYQNESGLFVPTDDPKECALAFERLYKDKNLRLSAVPADVVLSIIHVLILQYTVFQAQTESCDTSFRYFIEQMFANKNHDITKNNRVQQKNVEQRSKVHKCVLCGRLKKSEMGFIYYQRCM